MRRIVLSVGLTTMLLTGCGVGIQSHATSIPSRAIPPELLSPRETPPPSASQPASTSTIYLVRNGVLVGVHRPADETSTLSALLRSLLQGPTDAETQSGLVTAINTNPVLNRVTVSGSIASIDLASTFGDIRGQEQILATAQTRDDRGGLPRGRRRPDQSRRRARRRTAYRWNARKSAARARRLQPTSAAATASIEPGAERTCEPSGFLAVTRSAAQPTRSV